MYSKGERPTLQGQRIKTRKRDEKERFDPGAFRDSILQGFQEIHQQKLSPQTESIKTANQSSTKNNSPPSSVASTPESNPENNGKPDIVNVVNEENSNGTTVKEEVAVEKKSINFDALYRFLDSSGSKLNYRRYGEVLFDILIAGGILAPGGVVTNDQDKTKLTKVDICVFSTPLDEDETFQSFAQIFIKLIRRYMYLEKTLEDEFNKVIIYLKGFTPEERAKLAKFSAILISGGLLPVTVLQSAIQDHFVKDGIAIDFLIAVLQTWLIEKDAASIWASLKKTGLDHKLLQFLPVSKRSQEYLESLFVNNGLSSLLTFQKAGQSSAAKKELQNQVGDLLKDETNISLIISSVKEVVAREKITESEVVVLLWNSLMASVEWNKKDELVADQAFKHLKTYTPLLAAFTQTAKSELALIIRVQEFCYENMNFLKTFQKIIHFFYISDVLSEDVIAKWYKEAHSSKGRSVFLDQMKKFVEWLQNAEEESDSEED